MKNLKKRPPFDFVLEDLADIVTNIKPMFGAFGIYRDEQILMILRHKDDFVTDNGMWVAIADGQELALKTEIPQLRDIQMFGDGPTTWQVLGEELSSFEEICLQICELIRKRDPRIGRTPKKRLKKTKPQLKKASPSKKKSKKVRKSFKPKRSLRSKSRPSL